MKQQLEQENKQENTVHDPNREHMTLSALWQLWMDNLKSWRQYRDEHPDLFTLNLQAGVRHIAAWFRQVGGSAHHLVDENRHSSFPESEHGAAQLFLFFWNSLSRLGASLRERARNARKKLIRAGDRRRSYFEKLKLHPVAFLAVAMALATAATVLSLYTVAPTPSTTAQIWASCPPSTPWSWRCRRWRASPARRCMTAATRWTSPCLPRRRVSTSARK